MSPAAPVVALSSAAVTAEYEGRDERFLGTNAAYERAVLRAGGLPVTLPFGVRGQRARWALERADALVLTGGDDVTAPPAEPRPGHADPVRDASDAALLGAARDLGLPVLGVCRGLQLLTVRSGGTLRRVGGHAPPPGFGPRRHRVTLDEASWVVAEVGVSSGTVPSLHTFAVADPGRLDVVGRASDGVVEAVAARDRWELGVQWHPELSRGALGAPVWRAFVAAAARAAWGRGYAAAPAVSSAAAAAPALEVG